MWEKVVGKKVRGKEGRGAGEERARRGGEGSFFPISIFILILIFILFFFPFFFSFSSLLNLYWFTSTIYKTLIPVFLPLLHSLFSPFSLSPISLSLISLSLSLFFLSPPVVYHTLCT